MRRSAAPIPDNVFNTHERVRLVAAACKEIREGVGEGDWMIDFHQKFDFADALRCCRLIEEYEPFLVEDPVRDEQALEEIPKLRLMTTCPLSHGEEWGQRWDFHRLVYNKDIDYIRATMPNVGGITEMVKIMALCETSAVGIVPHFTGPVATAALVHTMATFSGPVLMEYNYGDRPPAYLPEFLTFKNGKLYPNDRPGIGVTVDFKALTQIGDFDQAAPQQCVQPAGWIVDALVSSPGSGGVFGDRRNLLSILRRTFPDIRILFETLCPIPDRGRDIGLWLALATRLGADAGAYRRARRVHGAGARRGATRTGRKSSNTSSTSRSGSSFGVPAKFSCGAPKREYMWYPRDGFFVRSPVRFNGVAISESEREKIRTELPEADEGPRRAREGAGQGNGRDRRRRRRPTFKASSSKRASRSSSRRHTC